MKVLGARYTFYVGFVVGACTLYVLLRQVGFTRNLGSVETEAHEKSLLEMIQEENKNWKKERSALFNLNHPHHTGKYNVETKAYKQQTQYIHCMSTASETVSIKCHTVYNKSINRPEMAEKLYVLCGT